MHRESVEPPRSKLLLRVFGALFARDLARSFHAVRCSGDMPTGPGPMVIFANHPSWWDGELFVWLATTTLADRRCYAPMDAAMLDKYRFFRRLGAFGVASGYASAATFLTIGRTVLARDGGVLLINAEGRFRDVRCRPLAVAPGLVHLARTCPDARFVPLAIEAAFWDERRPNLLLRFGESISAKMAARPDALGDALAATMDALASDAATRDPTRFVTLLAGGTTVHPVYDGWRRALALVRGTTFESAHGSARDRP